MCWFKIGTSQGWKMFQATPTKQDLGTIFLGVLFKISDQHSPQWPHLQTPSGSDRLIRWQRASMGNRKENKSHQKEWHPVKMTSITIIKFSLTPLIWCKNGDHQSPIPGTKREIQEVLPYISFIGMCCPTRGQGTKREREWPQRVWLFSHFGHKQGTDFNAWYE